MLNPPSSHVLFVYVGPLQTRGRLLKQISTLQRAGVTCELILGNTAFKDTTSAEADFPVRSLPVNIEHCQLRSFIETLRFCRLASRMIAESSADTVVCLTLGALMAGKWAKDLCPGLRIIYDNNELQIESIASLPKKVIWNWFQNRGVGACDVIFHAEQNRLDYFREHYHAGQGKEHVLIENFPHLLENSSSPIDPVDEVRVVYLGGFGSGRFTEEIIDAFSSMEPRYRLDIVGFGRPEYVEDIKTRLKARNVGHVRILPGIPHSSIPVFLRDYHIGVALYRNTNLNNYYCAPNKVYDYLMNGMPVITNRYPGLVKVVEDNRIGICIDKVNKDEIMRAIELIKSERRWENITPAIRQRYSWEWQQQRYLATFGLGHETAKLSNS